MGGDEAVQHSAQLVRVAEGARWQRELAGGRAFELVNGLVGRSTRHVEQATLVSGTPPTVCLGEIRADGVERTYELDADRPPVERGPPGGCDIGVIGQAGSPSIHQKIPDNTHTTGSRPDPNPRP